MATFDSFNAPQYSTFDDGDYEVEDYFALDHETSKPTCHYSPLVDEEFVVPDSTVTSKSTSEDLCLRSRRVKRSSSVGNMDQLVESVDNNIIINKKNYSAESEYPKSRSSDSSKPGLVKNKWNSQDTLNRLAKPKHKSDENLCSQQYVSVAEAVRNFQEQIPERFHSNTKKFGMKPLPFNFSTKPTIPFSPKLTTKDRTRKHQVLSHYEMEQQEIAEAKKFQIRAHPVNKRVLQGPLKPTVPVEKKPPTVQEPFNICAYKKKVPTQPQQQEFQFHARPVPKSVLEGPKLPPKQPIQTTIPLTPTFVRKLPQRSPMHKPEEIDESFHLTRTEPVPFSFEKRDERLHQKKIETFQKIVEMEKKAREFHAHPIPKSVLALIQQQKEKAPNTSIDSTSKQHPASTSALFQQQRGSLPHPIATSPTRRHPRSEVSVLNTIAPIKARPATVLYKKPFEPKKQDRHLVEIKEFNLASNQRAKERGEFDNKIRERKDQENEIIRKQEELREYLEMEEASKQRKEIVFKAQPVRKYKEVNVVPSGKVTEPISPVFRSGKSGKENRHV